MIGRIYQRVVMLSVILCFGGGSSAHALPIIGSFAPSSGVSGMGDPVLGDLQVLGGLPIIDGRGVPAVGGIEGAMLITIGLTTVVLSNPNLTGERGLSADVVGQLIDLMLSGGPTFNFLALDSVFAL